MARDWHRTGPAPVDAQHAEVDALSNFAKIRSESCQAAFLQAAPICSM